MKATTLNKKPAIKKPAPKVLAKKVKPKPGSWAAVLEAMEFAKKHPIKFVWE